MADGYEAHGVQTSLELKNDNDTFTYGSPRRTPDDRRGDAGSSPGIIARNVLGRDRILAREEPPVATLHGNTTEIRRQYAELTSWAKKGGLIVQPTRLGPEMDSMGEHKIHQPIKDHDAGRVLKVTSPHGAGMTRRPFRLIDGGKKLMEDFALPSEYLDRWQLHNELFGDDAQFEGVMETAHGPVMVMSQPYVEGDFPNEKEIKLTLEKSGWHPTGDGQWQRWHDGHLIGLADVKPSNWIKTKIGQIFAIDVIPFVVPNEIAHKWLPIPRAEE